MKKMRKERRQGNKERNEETRKGRIQQFGLIRLTYEKNPDLKKPKLKEYLPEKRPVIEPHRLKPK